MDDPLREPSREIGPLPTNDALPAEIEALQAGLQACPFCANRGDAPADGRSLANASFKPALVAEDVGGWWVRCWGCSARVLGRSAEHAAQRWNRRAAC